MKAKNMRRIGAGPRPALEAMSLADAIKRYSTRQDGFQRQDVVMFERVTIDADGANRIKLFTTSEGSNGISTTNFQRAGQMDDDTALLILAIAADIEPAGNPAAFGAQAAMNRVNDMHYLASRGDLKIFTGSNRVEAFRGGPLRVFPGNYGLGGVVTAADATTAGSDRQTRVQAVHTTGPAMVLKRPIMFKPGERYSGELDFGAAALSLPSSTDATILLRYHGVLWSKATN